MFKWFGIVSFTSAMRVSAFADHLREGRLMASRCKACGRRSFPPRADCPACLSPEFEWIEVSGRGRLASWTRVSAPPRGFEAHAPYTLAIVDLDEGGRALAPLGDSFAEETLAIGMPVRLVPRLRDDTEDIHVDYTLEAVERGARLVLPALAGTTLERRRD